MSNVNQKSQFPAHLSKLLTDGYTVIKNAASPSLVKDMAADLDPYFSSCPNSQGYFYGKHTVRFSGLFAKSQTSQRLAMDPGIHALLDHVLGPNCDRYQLNLTQAIEIQPGGEMQPPHKDDDMFPIEKSGVDFMVNVMWPLTRFSAANGATCIWPATHRQNLSEKDLPNLGAPDAAEAEPGDAIVWLGAVLHAGGANTTNEVRRGVVISYSLGWLRQAENSYLTYSRDELATFPRELQELLGFVAHRPNLGWVHGNEPLDALAASETLMPTRDLMDPESQARLEAFFGQDQ